MLKGSLPVVVDTFDIDKHYDTFKHLMRDVAEKGDGYTADEVTDEGLKNILKHDLKYAAIHEETGQLIGTVTTCDGALSRSVNSVTHSSFSVVDRNFRRYGLIDGEYIFFCILSSVVCFFFALD